MMKTDKSGKITAPSTRSRLKAERLGRRAEWLAAWALRLKGYSILQQRYRTRAGEVDIIARKGDLIAMVEVKARRNVQDAINAVTFQSRRRIANAGKYWLARQPEYARYSVRYDIIAVVPGKWPRHIPGAW